MKKTILSSILLLIVSTFFAQKQVYIPKFITNVNMDLNNASSQWAHVRSKQTDNIVVFWEAGFGADPTTATGDYQVNLNNLIANAEKTYAFYLDSLKFAIKGSSVTDKYKLMIFLLYSTEWAAYGSGQDELVGTLHVNPAAARANTVVAHEIGHCFEYITGCDVKAGGYRYGFGANASGGNGFWEQCAQWMSFKVYPGSQFNGVQAYTNANHLHIIHETPRYENYYIQDYWSYKHGMNFMGKLWRDSRKPEDPIETYKRITSITQTQFNDEIFEQAARMVTWDIPAIKSYGANYINTRAQTKMKLGTTNFWRVDTSVCLENYGYNAIKLNAPSAQSIVSVQFKGLAGEAGYRALNTTQGGWRFGFVALLKDGTRVYSEAKIANVINGQNPEQSLSFNCPANCQRLWLVVSGAPQTHWRHAWDDNNANDEHWPYEVKFENTNLLGIFNTPIQDLTLTYDVIMKPMSDYTFVPVALDESKINQAFSMTSADIAKALGSTIIYSGINPNGSLNSTSTANAPGHWFSNTGQTIGWGTGAYVFSELKLATMIANIGQYPDRAKIGDVYTIKQALVYTKSPTENVKIKNDVVGLSEDLEQASIVEVFPNPTQDKVFLSQAAYWMLIDQYGKERSRGETSEIDMSALTAGVYLLKVQDHTYKLIKE
jgi:hypothetical protein